jgi:predicted N-acetyltransferase YhbS
VKICPLIDCPEAIPTLVEWIIGEWHDIETRTPDEIAAQLRENLRREGLPITFVARRGAAFVGTASLDLSDLPSHDHLSPWLASVYVLPTERGAGVGAALIARVLAHAETCGVAEVFLWTAGDAGLYARRGWETMAMAQLAGRSITIMRRPRSRPPPPVP